MARGFNGFPGGGNIQALMQQAQKMQKEMQRVQAEAELFEAEGSAGGGAVKVTANGKNEILSVVIKPEAVDPADVEVLQDMIRLATNDALGKVRKNTEENLSRVTGGMNIPGLS
ncbi:MAG: YbaB/EbfC family nucleoid-associated protein [Pseudomonadota bacterium]|jgi:DNA-binding YbaB/EbfC family protein